MKPASFDILRKHLSLSRARIRIKTLELLAEPLLQKDSKSAMREKNLATSIEGTVTHVSDAGDLITDIAVEMIEAAPRDQSVTVSFGPHETLGIFGQDHSEPESTLIAFVGPSGFLEIGIVGVSIHKMLQVGVGEKIVVKW